MRAVRISWIWGTAAIIGLWLAFICYLLQQERASGNARGAASTALLRDAAYKAVRQQDAAAFQSLFRADSVGPQYASEYFTALFAEPVADLHLATVTRQDLRFLVLTGGEGTHAICSAWEVQDDGKRSMLLGAPTLTNVCMGA
jgi:hypothetical protein